MASVNMLNVLARLNGSSFIGLDTETVPKLLGGKKNPMIGRVKKHIKGSNVQVFQNKLVNGYEAIVKRRLEQEGKAASDFQLGSRPWGVRLEGLPIVEHKGKFYLEVIFLSSGEVRYTIDGADIHKDGIIGLPDEKEEGEQGGLSNKVVIRTFAFDSIKALRYGGEEYVGDFVYVP